MAPPGGPSLSAPATIQKGDAASAHVRGFLVLAGSQLVARLLTVASLAYLARVLEVEAFGAVGFATVVVAYAMVLVDSSIDLIGMRRIAGDAAEAATVVPTLVAVRVAMAALGLLLLAAASPLFAATPSGAGLVLLQGLTMLTFAVNLKWALQAFERNLPVGASFVLTQALNLGGLVALVHGPEQLLRVPLVQIASELAGASLLAVAYRGVRRPGSAARTGPSRELAATLVRDAMPMAGSRVLRAININSDLLVLGIAATPTAVGLYTAVSRILFALRELGDLYYIPLLPQLSRDALGEAGAVAPTLERALRVAGAIILPVAVVGSLTATDLLVFAFGSEFGSASVALRILLGGGVFMMLGAGYRLTLVALGRQDVLLPIMAGGAALAVALNVLLVPRLSIVGAALAATSSELLVLVLSMAAIRRSARVSLLRPIVRPSLAAAATGGLVALLPPLSFPVTAAIAVGAYLPLALALGAVELRELTGAPVEPSR